MVNWQEHRWRYGMAAILLGMPPNGGTSLNDGASFPGRVVVGDDVVCCSGGARRADMAGEQVREAVSAGLPRACGRFRSINEPRYAGSPRVGVAQVITSAIARLRGGGTLVEAFEEQSSRRFATQRITVERLITVFEQRRLPDESPAQVLEAARGVTAAAVLSDELGCQAVPCLEAVLTAYRQMRLMQNLRSQACAVPKATVGLLSALPAVTVALGELLGARPLAFLLGSPRGVVCLVLGGCCYAAGLAWMRALLKGSGL